MSNYERVSSFPDIFSFRGGKKTSITVDPGQLSDSAVYGTVLGSGLAN